MAKLSVKERRKKVDSIFDSAYQKLLDANATEETLLQIQEDADIDAYSEGYFFGKLLMKVIDDFLITKKCDSQTFCRILEMLKGCDRVEAEYEHFANGMTTIASSAETFATGYAINIAMKKIMQENSRFKELFEVVREGEDNDDEDEDE